jgi:hypothetical protein
MDPQKLPPIVRCAAIKHILRFLGLVKMIQMQVLNRYFYFKVVPARCGIITVKIEKFPRYYLPVDGTNQVITHDIKNQRSTLRVLNGNDGMFAFNEEAA